MAQDRAGGGSPRRGGSAGWGGEWPHPAAQHLRQFVEEEKIAVLNVAGSRASKAPDIHRWVMGVFEDAFFWEENHPGMLGGPGEG